MMNSFDIIEFFLQMFVRKEMLFSNWEKWVVRHATPRADSHNDQSRDRILQYCAYELQSELKGKETTWRGYPIVRVANPHDEIFPLTSEHRRWGDYDHWLVYACHPNVSMVRDIVNSER